MNFGFFFLFLIIQVIVNNVLSMFINTSNIFGLIAFYLLSCLIISFFGAFMSTPPGYKKDFYRHPGFHKTMLIYFVVFFALDLLMIFVF
jgi:hypothetical protein